MASPNDAPIGSGAAKMAADKIEAQKQYQQHVMDANENGEKPLSFDEFLKKKMTEKVSSPAVKDLGLGG